MSQADYIMMSYQELRHYFLTHRSDKAALQAYLERRSERSRAVITTLNDPNFDQKLQASIQQQRAEYQSEQH